MFIIWLFFPPQDEREPTGSKNFATFELETTWLSPFSMQLPTCVSTIGLVLIKASSDKFSETRLVTLEKVVQVFSVRLKPEPVLLVMLMASLEHV